MSSASPRFVKIADSAIFCCDGVYLCVADLGEVSCTGPQRSDTECYLPEFRSEQVWSCSWPISYMSYLIRPSSLRMNLDSLFLACVK